MDDANFSLEKIISKAKKKKSSYDFTAIIKQNFSE